MTRIITPPWPADLMAICRNDCAARGETPCWKIDADVQPHHAGYAMRGQVCDGCYSLWQSDHDAIAKKALRMALPVMRRAAWEYFASVTVKGDPATICHAEWREIAPDVRAILAAELCVDPQPDLEVVDTDWLNACIAAAPAWVKETSHD